MSSRMILFAVLLAGSSAAKADLSIQTPIVVSPDAMLQSMNSDGVLQLPQRDVIDVVAGSLDDEPHHMEIQRVQISIGQPTKRHGLMTTNDVLHGQHVHKAYIDIEPVTKWGMVNPFVHDRIHVVYESAGLVGKQTLNTGPSNQTNVDRHQDVRLDELPWPTFKHLSEVDPRSHVAASYPPAVDDFLDTKSDLHAWDDKRWSQSVSLEAQAREILFQRWRDIDQERNQGRNQRREQYDQDWYRDWDRERCRDMNRW